MRQQSQPSQPNHLVLQRSKKRRLSLMIYDLSVNPLKPSLPNSGMAQAKEQQPSCW
jgi:hypothetical protein